MMRWRRCGGGHLWLCWLLDMGKGCCVERAERARYKRDVEKREIIERQPERGIPEEKPIG